VGKTRFGLIQDRWEGGDVEGELYKVNFPREYFGIVEERVMVVNRELEETIRGD
jgi:hypothetical protein